MLEILGVHHRKQGRKRSTRYFLCRCVCGNECIVSESNVKTQKGCGCQRKGVNLKHGHGPSGSKAKSRTYSSWQAMKSRCNNPNATSYKRYGGRGIKVCERWDTFENFLADMGERPEGMTLDRKDTDGDYTPDNCVWSTPVKQVHNRRGSYGRRT